MTLFDAPKPDELEVSLFGPGVGECLAVHLGLGDWLVVDSCIDPATREPVVIGYLHDLNVNIATHVKQLVVSHWHDDHMKGASRILAAATGARFVCSAAFQRDEFKEFIGASRDLNMRTRESTGVEEFAKIMQILLSRREAGARKETVGPEWARADYILYRRPATNDAPACEVVALSPSSATLSRGLHEIASLLPKLGESRRAAVSVEPNETSLVLCVRFGNALCLLGADLENGSGSNVGWEAVLKTVALPAERVHVFKVPHHGSENAYHSGVWTGALLPQDPIAIVTPFARGRKTLPAPEDLARMKQHTKRLYCTSPRAPRATLGDPMVERTIREVARDFRPRAGRMGQVRVRLNAATATPTIELFGAAFPA